MEQEDASNVKPQQSDDEDSDFPEFEFPVGDCVDVDAARLAVREGEKTAEHQEENGDRVVARAGPARVVHVDESPKKMPPAMMMIRSTSDGPDQQLLADPPRSEEPAQPEVSKHVVAEESKIPTVLLASQASQRKVLQSNPSFKSLVTILGEPLKFQSTAQSNAEAPKSGDPGHDDAGDDTESGITAPLTPTSKRLNGILSRVNAKVAAHAHAQQHGDPGSKTTTPDHRPGSRQATNTTMSVNALVEKFSTGVRLRASEGTRRESLVANSSTPRNLTSPRRTVADRSRSPILHNITAPTTPRTLSSPRRSSQTTDRSVSPVPRSWKDSVYGDLPKDRRPNLSKPDHAPPPRFLTPTRAASLKAVKPPATPSNGQPNSRLLQYTTAFGITTPVKPHSEPASRRSSSIYRDHTPTKGDHHENGSTYHNGHVKGMVPKVTEPTGFNFRTDERAERRKDFYSKLEERMKVKEMERKRAEAKAQEEKESQLRELRKSLTYKANPVPRFYQEPAPVAPEIRRIAPTRAKSPNFTVPRRRDSCPGSTVSEGYASSRTSPLRSRTLLRCASLESNSGHSSSGYRASVPKPKQPFRPV